VRPTDGRVLFCNGLGRGSASRTERLLDRTPCPRSTSTPVPAPCGMRPAYVAFDSVPPDCRLWEGREIRSSKGHSLVCVYPLSALLCRIMIGTSSFVETYAYRTIIPPRISAATWAACT
jgi:hypothetical protein